MKKHDHHKMSHSGHSMNMGGNLAQDFLKRFWIVTFLLIPLALSNEMVAEFVGIDTLPFSKWIGLGIATIIFYFSFVFFQHAYHEIKSRKYGMMTLVSLALVSGYVFSVVSTFLPSLQTEFYLEIATLVWVLLFGHYLEARSSSSAGDALEEVAKLLPKKAHKIENGETVEVAVAELETGDIVLVKPGEKVPADGVIKEGSANMNEAHISGESKPVEKKEGDEVIAGSICLDGSLTIELSRVGEHSTVGQIEKLVATAKQTKPNSQRIADKASTVLTAVAGVTALLTLVVWFFFLGEPFTFAITLAITVLVIACPHALGLAIPTVTTITTSLAVKNGVFIKDLSKIEVIKDVDYIVFDKTGTLTEGEFGVKEVVPIVYTTGEEVLSITASLETHSSHVIGRAIVDHAKSKGVKFREVSDVKNIAGKGIQAKVEGKEYFVGNKSLMKDKGVLKGDIEEKQKQFEDRKETLVYLANNEKVIGLISLADNLKENAVEPVKQLQEMGVKIAMLTGDNEEVAKNVADDLGIDTYFAEVLPENKYTYVKELQEKGNIVLMVGDGVNDAPALTQANVGVAVGAGTDVAVEAGDVVLIENDLRDVVNLVMLSKKVYSKMVQNIFWAFGYNIVAIPAAAGVFAVWGFFLRPEIGALLMSMSTVIVVINALTLKRLKFD